SRPNRLFSGYTHVVATDTNGDNWQEAVQVSTTGATVAIPNMPTYAVSGQGGGPIGLTALGTGRETNAIGPTGVFFNGTAVFVGTLADAARNAMGDPQDAIDPSQGAPLYMTVIPDTLPWPPPNTGWGDRAWVRITPDVNGDGIPDTFGDIKQIL